MNIIRELILKQLRQAKTTIEFDEKSSENIKIDKIGDTIIVNNNYNKCSYLTQDYLIILVLLRQNIEDFEEASNEAIYMLSYIYNHCSLSALRELINVH